MRLFCVDCTNTLFTWSSFSESLSTKKTRSDERDSRKTPGVIEETSSRLARSRWYSTLSACAQGATTNERSAHTSATGTVKATTGRTHAAIDKPDVNHTVISLS